MKTLFLLLISASAYSQPNISLGVGKSLTSIAITAQAGVGFRIGPMLYVEGNVKGYTNGYPAAAIGSVIGAAHSWNNGAGHELTTIIYAKADWVLAANSGYKDDPPTPFGFGVRHYVYEFFVDASWQHSQAVFTIGYSLNSLYR